MGFWDSVLNGAAGVLNIAANSIDKKSDEELEDSFEKSADEMRDLAARAHMFYEQQHIEDGDDYDC